MGSPSHKLEAQTRFTDIPYMDLTPFVLSFATIALCGGPAFAGTIDGTASPGAVVWASPVAPLKTTANAPQLAEIRNINRAFDPALVVLPVGSSVRFSNEDPFFHSIFSASQADPFDLGFYSIGPGKTVSFPTPGVIRVHCHIHRVMRAVIIVVDGPVTRASAQSGAFTLAGISSGNYVIHAWDPQAETEKSVPLALTRNAQAVTLPQPLRP